MSLKCPLRFAIVGTGLIGPRHAEAVVKNPDTDLACIVDPNPAAEAVAQQLGCPLFASVEKMLASRYKPDAALVCTPNHTHVTISKELIEGGVHVLCEKPISVDAASGRELVIHPKQILVGHHRRFNRYVVTTKRLLPSLGKIIAVNGLWTINKPPQYFDPPTEWRRSATAGPIFINLIHEIDILHYLIGPIVRVYAEQTESQRNYAAEEGAAITLRFANGVVGTFVLSDAVVSPYSFEGGTGENPTIPKTGEAFYKIFGSEGSLSVPDMTRWSYRGNEKSWNEHLTSETLSVPDMKVPFELQIDHFVRVIKGQEAPSCSGIEGLRAVLVCEAIRNSMRTGQPVDVVMETSKF
ncbi:NAD(P)-binding protein [Polyplosphaeria fusca]|uniref:NAD(P)-binding protein n=1 Tax=Polyplosphaeria fusca TaxID=682080 RepID=A0A9P4V1B3_9PLEO|nr:NAD(P)-binding protein [Polyplosphaeria fusca]